MNKTVTVGNILITFLIAVSLAFTATVAYLYHRLNVAQAYSKRLDDQIWKANHDLQETSARLQETQRQLAATQSALGQTQSQLNAAQTESQKRLAIIFGQQENVDALKRCLLGVAAEHVYFRDGMKYYFQWRDSRDDDDLDQAVDNLKKARDIEDGIDGLCSRAAKLF